MFLLSYFPKGMNYASVCARWKYRSKGIFFVSTPPRFSARYSISYERKDGWNEGRKEEYDKGGRNGGWKKGRISKKLVLFIHY